MGETEKQEISTAAGGETLMFVKNEAAPIAGGHAMAIPGSEPLDD